MSISCSTALSKSEGEERSDMKQFLSIFPSDGCIAHSDLKRWLSQQMFPRLTESCPSVHPCFPPSSSKQ